MLKSTDGKTEEIETKLCRQCKLQLSDIETASNVNCSKCDCLSARLSQEDFDKLVKERNEIQKRILNAADIKIKSSTTEKYGKWIKCGKELVGYYDSSEISQNVAIENFIILNILKQRAEINSLRQEIERLNQNIEKQKLI